MLRKPLKKHTLKRYPHFDQYLSTEKIENIVTNPEKVRKNAFFPFLEFEDKWTKFNGNKKSRKFRYASRRDAYIYSHYRYLLSEKYKAELIRYNLQDYPIAYRKIPISENSLAGKCNVHFAKDAFYEILRRGSCYAIVIDIKSFFDSIDHVKLYQKWCNLLGVQTLPPDHEAVFKHITNYAVVNRHKCYERFGYIEERVINGKLKTRLKKLPLQLAKPLEFQKKICGDDPNFSSLVSKNENPFGIPQGSPISDVLANLYLLGFDRNVAELARNIGGYYRRYSDDILFICPPEKILSRMLLIS